MYQRERAAHERTKAELDEVRENRGKVAVELLEKAQRERAEARAERAAAQVRADKAEGALTKIGAIRDSIVGTQSINWSEHIYPLVAALTEAGFEGAGYEISRKNMGTVIEQRDRAIAERDAAQAEAAAMRAAIWIPVLSPTPPYRCCRICRGVHPDEPNPRGFTNVGHQPDCAFNNTAGHALASHVKEQRDVLVYARDQLDHLAKFHGIDMTLLRKMIVRLLGDPAPEVGSTFRDALVALDENSQLPPDKA
jgi:hypothetical protein